MAFLLKRSLRSQIFIGISLIHSVLISLFLIDLVGRQSQFLHRESINSANGLAQTLATNSAVWALAKDYSGLQEVVLAQMKYPNVKMAMVYGLDGKIWAHSDSSKIGLFIEEPNSSGLLSTAEGDIVTLESTNSISSIKSVESKGIVLGKVWIVLSEERLQQSTSKLIQDGIIYALIAIATGIIFAFLVTNAMTKRLQQLVTVAQRVQRGDKDLRVRLDPVDELGKLGEVFDSMLESLEEKQKVLERSQAAEKAANQAKSDFLANMSHEIRTPINTMVGIADALAETQLSSEQQKFVKIFQRAGSNLTNLVNDILDLSKIEAGELKIRKEPCSIEDVFSDISMLCSESAAGKHLALRFEISADVPKFLIGDRDRIRQILLNLVSNAVKFTEKGSVDVTAYRLILPDQTQAICFTVEDTGIGIPDDKKEILFERFQQVDRVMSRKTSGTGLGLAISKGLVEKMGGEIGFESRYAIGSKFFFTLPLEEHSPYNFRAST